MTLDQKITIYRVERTKKPDLTFDVNRVRRCHAMAKVVLQGGGESIEGDQAQPEAMVYFTVHYRRDVLASDVISWNGKDHNIRRIQDKGQGSIYLTIEAEQGVAV